ncbi:hypothetical protein HPP92_004205 [Vanilla planifolia]|uniref:Uncharacterized protein n=1 Tax=Vanilla planifolia TaxID=51239 RepID=A0A835RFB8_VANPL|nr:hypothetical protein HPP92_004653 [Vanilla planifolia]KAG0493211.1 hypothetical protein HPP92_004205 [Vanilla planifolia]
MRNPPLRTVQWTSQRGDSDRRGRTPRNWLSMPSCFSRLHRENHPPVALRPQPLVEEDVEHFAAHVIETDVNGLGETPVIGEPSA